MIALMFITGCNSRRPDFMTRVQEDCAAGDSWACELVDAIHHPIPVDDTKTPKGVRDDVGAILKGIDRTRSAPRLGSPYVPPMAVVLQN
jgi:hypothetical protein